MIVYLSWIFLVSECCYLVAAKATEGCMRLIALLTRGLHE